MSQENICEQVIREELSHVLESSMFAHRVPRGDEKAAKISLTAYHEDLSLREAVLELGFLTGEQFDSWVRPEEMTHPPGRKGVSGPWKVVILGAGVRGRSAAGSAPTYFNFNREMARVQHEPAHSALQR